MVPCLSLSCILHMVSGQKLDEGKAWQWGQAKGSFSQRYFQSLCADLWLTNLKTTSSARTRQNHFLSLSQEEKRSISVFLQPAAMPVLPPIGWHPPPLLFTKWPEPISTVHCTHADVSKTVAWEPWGLRELALSLCSCESLMATVLSIYCSEC